MARARRARSIASVCGALALAALLDAPSALGQTPPSGGKPDARPPEQTAPPPDIEAVDVFDLLRAIRHKELTASRNGRPRRIRPRDVRVRARHRLQALERRAWSAWPATSAFFRGDPKTTHISSAVAALTFSSLKQTSATARFGVFTRDDRWKSRATTGSSGRRRTPSAWARRRRRPTR